MEFFHSLIFKKFRFLQVRKDKKLLSICLTYLKARFGRKFAWIWLRVSRFLGRRKVVHYDFFLGFSNSSKFFGVIEASLKRVFYIYHFPCQISSVTRRIAKIHITCQLPPFIYGKRLDYMFPCWSTSRKIRLLISLQKMAYNAEFTNILRVFRLEPHSVRSGNLV